MLKQHFKAIKEYAEKMTSGQQPEPTNSPDRSLDSPVMGFDQQLAQGLYTPMSQLAKNDAGWSYRNVPVILYKQPGSLNYVHFSSRCDVLNNNSERDWVWVSSTHESITQPGYEWCDHCLASTGLQHKKNELGFIDFVKQNSHHYFREQSIKYWSAGEPISHQIAPQQEDIEDEIEEKSQEYFQCDTCTWKLRGDSPYLLKDKHHHCILCMQAHTEKVLVIAEDIRWQALQQR